MVRTPKEKNNKETSISFLFCNYIQRKVFSFAAFLICRLNSNYLESLEMVRFKPNSLILILEQIQINRSHSNDSVPFTSKVLVKILVNLQRHESQILSLSFGWRPACNPFI